MIVVPFATGSQTYVVLTGSMAPGYPPGTLVVVRPHDFGALRVGDVVTYQLTSGQPEVVTHRIVALTSDQQGERLLITRGDANDLDDPEPVREVQVRGKLFYAVPYAGFLANALQTNRGAAVNILAVALIGYGSITVVRGVLGRRREPHDATGSPEAAGTRVAAKVEADARGTE
ncbi:signal peptidase I [Tessaracoccus rhinocerotis]|uniref:Signal peptidase I n=2 Tax=Tessaracoccus rhinocerotis TaxID=1689449 RepID=A0A553JZM8_9ACTN|nr:signal peptidase I [Tessaracoccus rhinocerotis]